MNRSSEEEWEWETDEEFAAGEFKLLLDDKVSELGESHPLYPGASILINPKFPVTPKRL